MSENSLISLILIVLCCATVLKLLNFAGSNRLNNALLLWAYSFLLCVFCLGHAFEITADSLKVKVFFNSFKTYSFCFLPAVIFLVFTDIVYGIRKIKPLHYVLLFFIPVMTLILRATSGFHTAFFYNFSIIEKGSFSYLSQSYGFWFYIYNIYVALVMGLCAYMAIKWFSKNQNRKVLICAIVFVIATSIVCIYLKAAQSSPITVMAAPLIVPLFSLLLSSNSVSYTLFGAIPYAYKRAFERSNNCLMILNNDLNLLDFNTAAEQNIPLLSEEMLGNNINEFIDYDGRIKNCLLNENECNINIVKNYSVMHYRISGTVLYDKSKSKSGYLVSLIDITELSETMSELTELASVDTLTRTSTRRYFIQSASIEFARAKRHGHPLSFIILDLDFFKNINDEYGHLAGDEMLKEIAAICKSKIRSIDLLGRFGGEEFILLLPETDLENALFVAERIRKSIEKNEFKYENLTMSMTVSLGVTGGNPITEENFDLFLKYADRALYKAKDNGRNKVEYEECKLN